MTTLLTELERQARALAPDERAHLARILLESLDDTSSVEIDTAWDREIEHRVAAYDEGESTTYPAEDVFLEAKRIDR